MSALDKYGAGGGRQFRRNLTTWLHFLEPAKTQSRNL